MKFALVVLQGIQGGMYFTHRMLILVIFNIQSLLRMMGHRD
jgi:hypothetical protein